MITGKDDARGVAFLLHGYSLLLLKNTYQNTEQLLADCPCFFFGLCNLEVALSDACLSDPVEKFSP